MPYQLGEGTRRAALRWLEHLHRADIPRLRALFTHHPDYADLTPAQYAEALTWLKKAGMLSGEACLAGDVTEADSGESGSSSRHSLWTAASAERRARTGAAGEQELLALLRRYGARSVVQVSALSDTYGYDLKVMTATEQRIHLEVKATTDPTRLVVHLTRHESDVMREDAAWILGAVLLGEDSRALSVATVSREWLGSVLPADQSSAGRWESVRLAVPAHALSPGLRAADGERAVPPVALLSPTAWGMRDFSDVRVRKPTLSLRQATSAAGGLM
ncbi:DUF3883 domain-containing protein [Streptomyces sp. NBC_00101]|uniref:protein NO VEIN domain-containing protein n=1 Tax=Streptomyces sp. NBC_00101 TaxID=2975651 RepID=UPI00324C9869